MKKTVVAILGMAMLAPMAWAQTNVLSQNAVGYVKVTAEAGKLYLLRTDFENIDGSAITMKSLIGNQVPNNSQAFIWDRAANGGTGDYVTELKGGRAGDWPDAGTEIQRGDAFWLSVPSGAAGGPFEVYLLGEVPGSNNGADMTTVANIDTDAVGYPYPAEINFGATTISTAAPAGSQVFFWDPNLGGNGDYIGDLKGGRAGDWAQGTKDRIIKPGEGFWLVMGTELDWDEVKPYAWP